MKISVFELRLKVYTLVDINLEEVLSTEAEYIDSAFALDDEWLRFHENLSLSKGWHIQKR